MYQLTHIFYSIYLCFLCIINYLLGSNFVKFTYFIILYNQEKNLSKILSQSMIQNLQLQGIYFSQHTSSSQNASTKASKCQYKNNHNYDTYQLVKLSRYDCSGHSWRLFNALLIIMISMMMLVTPVQSQQQTLKPQLPQIAQLAELTQQIPIILKSMLYHTYTGKFKSFDQEDILNWITQKQGQIYLFTQEYLETKQDKNNQNAKQFSFQNFVDRKRPSTTQINQNLSQQNKYNVQLMLLNPQYVSQQELIINFHVYPDRFIPPQPNQYPLSNTTDQKCQILEQNSWQCNNTRINFTKYWRQGTVDSNPEENNNFTLIVDYKMKLAATEMDGDVYKSNNISIEFQIRKSQFQDNGAANLHIHFATQQPLIKLDRRFQLILYSLFVSSIVLIQIFCAFTISKKLNNNHPMASKLSIVTLCFCTILDLSCMIDFCIRGIQTQDQVKRLFNILPCIQYGILYFVYDIQILTRILISKFNNRVQRLGAENVSLKKALIGFYVSLLISYQGFIILRAYFQYEWWLIILTSLMILTPQIVRNVRKGHGGDDGFNIPYYVGFLMTKFLIILYEHGCPYNYLKIKPFLWLIILLASIISLQVLILYFQSKLSARFFIPEFLRPGFFSYSHKIILDNQWKQAHPQFQCSICLQSLLPEGYKKEQQQHLQDNQQNKGQSQITQKFFKKKQKPVQITVYRTPCNHFFHEECLKSWMQVKLQCPSCRNQLPII